MSISLETRASTVVAGRCSDCGRFISRHESHFHGPKRKFRGRPRAHLFYDGGGMVTRCDDTTLAWLLLVREYAYTVLGIRWQDLDEDDCADVIAQFPETKGEVQRGRINVVAPGRDEVSWRWMRLGDNAKGLGVTTAVVWLP